MTKMIKIPMNPLWHHYIVYSVWPTVQKPKDNKTEKEMKQTLTITI